MVYLGKQGTGISNEVSIITKARGARGTSKSDWGIGKTEGMKLVVSFERLVAVS